MMTLQTPLLAEEAPHLHNSFYPTNDDEGLSEPESEFARLIAQQSPEELCSVTFQVPRLPITRTKFEYTYRLRKGALIFASTGSMLCIGFIWGSYMAQEWLQMQTNVSTLAEVSEALIPTRQSLTLNYHSLSLPTIIQKLYQTNQTFMLAIIWITSLLLPCLGMVLLPTNIFMDHRQQHSMPNHEIRIRQWTGRKFVENILRFSLFVIFTLILWGVPMNGIVLRLNESQLALRFTVQGPACAYAMGVLSGLLAITALRSPLLRTEKRAIGAQDLDEQDCTPDEQESDGVDDDELLRMLPLEEDVLAGVSSTAGQVANAPTGRNNGTDVTRSYVAGSSTPVTKVKFWQKVAVYQFGLLSVLLWWPSVNFPFLAVHYQGVGSMLLTSPAHHVYLWGIATQSIRNGDVSWMGIFLVFLWVLFVILVPLLLTVLCMLAWLSDNPLAKSSRMGVHMLQPLNGGLVASLALCLAISSTHTTLQSEVTDWSSIASFACFGEDCLSVSLRLLPGGISYLFLSIVLELFVWTSLYWY